MDLASVRVTLWPAPATTLGGTAQNNGYYAFENHSMSQTYVPTESPYAAFYQ